MDEKWFPRGCKAKPAQAKKKQHIFQYFLIETQNWVLPISRRLNQSVFLGQNFTKRRKINS
jgi:hypothetical protein